MFHLRQILLVRSMRAGLRRATEAAGARLIEAGVGALSLGRAAALGGGLLRTLGPRLGVSRTAQTNLARAFPPDQARELLRPVWDNLGRTLFEYPHLAALHEGGRIEFRGLDVLAETLAAGRGAVFFSGHLANWECLTFLAGHAGFDALIVHREPNNPHVARLLERCRPKRNLRFVAKSQSGTLEAFATLAANGCVGFLIDHRYNRGVAVDFLGGTALVAPTAALMVRRQRCPLLPVRVERLADGGYRVSVHPPLAVDFALPAEEFSQAVMQGAMSLLEKWIRERPEQWFWMQRLWR